ncbi:MAG TPA: hypothetical protein PLF78_14260 [Caulobacter sp.]|nr:hypothetical protein [Caulobacter sp.]
MRSHALLGLTAAAVFATAAFAQETPATPTAEPTPVPAAEVPAPPPEPTPAPPAPPPVPTNVTSLAVLDVLTRVCAESVRGGDMKALAAQAGFKLKKDVWVRTYTKGYTISVSPPGTNPQVCNVVVLHPVDGVTPDEALKTILKYTTGRWARAGTCTATTRASRTWNAPPGRGKCVAKPSRKPWSW